MAIAKGQALQGQKDVEQQVRQDIRQSSGRKQRVETRSRRCGACGKTSHNSRTCQVTVRISNEEDSVQD